MVAGGALALASGGVATGGAEHATINAVAMASFPRTARCYVRGIGPAAKSEFGLMLVRRGERVVFSVTPEEAR
jgi:hypothetical protein